MLIEEEPDVDFSFALGGDTFMDLSDWKWRRSRDVLKLLDGRIVVFVRKGHDVQELERRVERTNSSSEGGHVKLLRVSSLEAVSSTLARSSKEEADLQGMVHGKVLEYIITNGLYGFNDAS
jgi:nicotinic acid mononucleotide adenylyltransferase